MAPVHHTKYQTEREHNAFNANYWQLPIGARGSRRNRATNFDQG
jgi:hypothetical protein